MSLEIWIDLYNFRTCDLSGQDFRWRIIDDTSWISNDDFVDLFVDVESRVSLVVRRLMNY